MRTLIDGDVLRYELGNVANSVDIHFGQKVLRPWERSRVEDLVEKRIETIVRRTDATGYEVFLSAGSNYRYDIAKTHPYKGQRTESKPHHWSTIGEILVQECGAYTVHGAEADDVLSLFARQAPDETCIASRDKDLRIVPCWQYSWRCGESQPEIVMHKVDTLGTIEARPRPSGGYKLVGEGLKFFYGQVICGDDIDNYKGCPGVGPQGAMAALYGCSSEEELWEATYWVFAKKLGPERGYELLLENARLAWLLDDAEVKEDGDQLFVTPRALWEPPSAIPNGFK